MEIKDLTPEQIEQFKTAESAEELKTVAAEQGIAVTDEEIAFVWKALKEQDINELSENELENVAGGCGKSGPQEYETKGFWAPICDGRFNPEIRMPSRHNKCCGNCKHFYPYEGRPQERWSGPGKCRREFED